MAVHCFEEVREQMQRLRDDTAIPDLIFLTPRDNIGTAFVEKCKEKGINVIHTFGQADEKLIDSNETIPSPIYEVLS